MFSRFYPVIILLVVTAIKSELSFGDIKYGIAQAEKAAVGVCWIEKNPDKMYDGGATFTYCKMGNDYIESLNSITRDQITHESVGSEAMLEKDADMYKKNLSSSIGSKIQWNLPSYSSCLHYLYKIHNAPIKDYGWLIGDSEKGEYPYKAFTHCLLEVMEDQNGQQGLDDLKSKWDNDPNGYTALYTVI